MDSKKKFDAVEASRRWREASGKRLSGLSREQRLSSLNDDLEAKLKALTKQATKTLSARKSKRATAAA